MNDGTIDFMAYYFDTCQQVESDFQLKIKDNFPVYLESMQTYFQQVESNQFCETVYGRPFSLTGNVQAI